MGTKTSSRSERKAETTDVDDDIRAAIVSHLSNSQGATTQEPGVPPQPTSPWTINDLSSPEPEPQSADATIYRKPRPTVFFSPTPSLPGATTD